MLYGTSTFGNRNGNVSLGLGFGYSKDGIGSIPVINISGLKRVSQRGYLITENYIISGEGETVVMLMFGGRHIIKRVGLDYGLIIPTGSGVDELIALPWLGISIPFGAN